MGGLGLRSLHDWLFINLDNGLYGVRIWQVNVSAHSYVVHIGSINNFLNLLNILDSVAGVSRWVLLGVRTSSFSEKFVK